jgi:hypothetical protein
VFNEGGTAVNPSFEEVLTSDTDGFFLLPEFQAVRLVDKTK